MSPALEQLRLALQLAAMKFTRAEDALVASPVDVDPAVFDQRRAAYEERVLALDDAAERFATTKAIYDVAKFVVDVDDEEHPEGGLA